MAKRNVYRGGNKATESEKLFNHRLQYQWINPQLTRAKAISDKVLHEEYSRLRAIANKRIKRMAGRPEAAVTYEAHAEGFPSVRGMSRDEVVYQLNQVTNFLTADRGSLSGIKEVNQKILKELNKPRKDPQTGKEERPALNIAPDQLGQFGTFMNKLKKALGIQRGEYASGQLASYWESLMENGKISRKKFNDTIDELLLDLDEVRGVDMEEEKAVKRLARTTNLSDYFGTLKLDPRTRAAEERKRKRKK